MFEINCKNCFRLIEFEVHDIPKLEDHIWDVRDDAAREALFEARLFDPNSEVDPQLIHDLSAALAHDSLDDARFLLDMLAREMGDEYREQCERGRFTLRIMSQ